MNQLNEDIRCLRQSISLIDKRLKEIYDEAEVLEEAREELQKQLLDDLDECVGGQ